MNLKTLLGMLLLFLLTTGCGKSSATKKRETRITEDQIQEVMNNQDFECASVNGNCPGGMSRLLTINRNEPDRSAACTGFMVSANRLVTNHHCVSTADQCANTYIAIYNGSNYEQSKCKTIIKTEQDVADPNDRKRQIDFTVMEITVPYSGEFFNLSNKLASGGDQIHSWVIDHTGLDQFPSNLTESRITEFECLVMDQTSRASLVMLTCPTISGNSGAPALNANGEVIGVIWGGTAISIDSNYPLVLRRELDEIALATEVNFFRPYVHAP